MKAAVELQLARVGNPGAAQLVEQEQAEQAAAQGAQTANVQQQQLVLSVQQAMAPRPSMQPLPGPPAFGLPLAGAMPMPAGTWSYQWACHALSGRLQSPNIRLAGTCLWILCGAASMLHVCCSGPCIWPEC